MQPFPAATGGPRRPFNYWQLALLPLGLLEYQLGEHPGWTGIAWLTPFLWLLFFHAARAGWAFVAGVATLTAIYGTQHEVNILRGAAFHLTNLLFAVTYLLPFLIHRMLAPRAARAYRWLVLPLAAVTTEYLVALGPNGTWGSVGYTQKNIYLLQLTAITGIYGIVFVLYLNATLWFEAWQARRAGEKGYRFGGLALGLAAVWLGFGFGRLHSSGVVRDAVRVMGLTFQDSRSWPWFQQVVWDRSLTLRADSATIRQKSRVAHAYFLAQTEKYARLHRPQWVIWSEAALLVRQRDLQEFAALNARFAVRNGLYLGVTYFLVGEDFPASKGANHFTIFSPQGRILYDYSKNKPAAPLEPATASTTPPTVFTVDAVAYSGAICADFDYPALIRAIGAADIVFAPSADWPGIRDLHARMANVRAIENGFALFRIAGNGKATLSNAHGETSNSQYHLAKEVQAFVTTIPVHKSFTIYRLWGDVFAWLCLSGLLLVPTIHFIKQGQRLKVGRHSGRP